MPTERFEALMQKIDMSRTCYVLIRLPDKKSLVMDPTTRQPWHAYAEPAAQRMQKIIRDEDGINTAVITFQEALVHFCAMEGVKLSPPFTAEHVIEQLKNSFLANQVRKN